MDLFIGTKDITDARRQVIGKDKYIFGEGSNDLVIGPNGDFMYFEGTTKLQQDILKVVLTDRFTSTVYPIFGSTIRSLLGNKMDMDIIKTQMRSIIIEALGVLQYINSDNQNLDEQIDTVQYISVDLVNITEVKVSIQVITKAGNTISASTVITK